MPPPGFYAETSGTPYRNVAPARLPGVRDSFGIAPAKPVRC
jgi:hypothetical protein